MIRFKRKDLNNRYIFIKNKIAGMNFLNKIKFLESNKIKYTIINDVFCKYIFVNSCIVNTIIKKDDDDY